VKLSKSIIKAAQHACRMDDTDIDGIIGPKTIAAAREYDEECEDIDVPLSDSRALIATVAQHAAGLRGGDLDGVPGPRTMAAVSAYLKANAIEADEATAPAKPSSWAVWQPCENPGEYVKSGVDLRDGAVIVPSGGLDPIPNRDIRDAIFGDAYKLGSRGMASRMTTIEGLPGRFNKGTGVLPVVHKKIVPHVVLAFELLQLFGVLDEIYRIWFFNYRHQRHDSSRPLSLHSWGIACDINARENFAWSPKGEQRKVQPFTDAWYERYPRGLSEIAVLCMKKAGFRWGGDWPRFRDPMHFQLLA
jgi:hypothetical protein